MTTVSLVKIDSFMGIEALEFAPGKGLNVITGDNGRGKTSLLEAIKNALSGGHDVSVLRDGEPAEVYLELQGGDADGWSVRRRTSEAGAPAVLRDADDKIQRSPQEKINKLFSKEALNPVEFLMAPKRERLNWLFRAIPLRVTEAQIQEAVGTDDPQDVSERHALEVLADLLGFYVAERNMNERSLKDKRVHLSQLQLTLPDVVGEDAQAALLKAQIEKAGVDEGAAVSILTLRNANAVTMNRKRDAFEISRSNLKDYEATQLAQARADYDTKVATIKELGAREIAALTTEFQNTLTSADTVLANEIAAVNLGCAEQREHLTEEIGRLTSLVGQDAVAKNTRSQIEKVQAEVNDLADHAERYDTTVSNLKALKATLTGSLPIPGMEVKDGDIYIDGVAFDRVNLSRKVAAAIRLAKHYAGTLPIMCVDGLECMGDTMWEAFKAAMADGGLQMFVTRVGKGALRVESL
jgi:AAA domain-containing protein